MSSALMIIAAVTLFALYLGVRACHGYDMSLEQWTVGGRSFGAAFVFLLMAGEIYTTFTFLGGSGFAYSKGAAVYYIPAYGTLAYILSYWLLPPIWRFAKTHRLVSQPDFFACKYDSHALGVLVAMVDVAALIPYLVLQLKGLGIIVAMTSYGAISSSVGISIGAAVVTIYVIASGVRGSAWNSVMKDLMIFAVGLFLGIYLPIHYYGSIGQMFHAIDAVRPGFLTFSDKGPSVIWFQSTVLLSALGFFMWPHTFGSVFTAKHERIFRRNATVQPIYQLILLFVFFVGFAATLKVPGLKGGDIDLSLFRLSIQSFDPWVVGVIGAAGVLTALVPGSMILITASTLLANDIYRGWFQPRTCDVSVAKLARMLAPVVALVAVLFALHGGKTIVALLLMGYNFVTQLFPALVCSLSPRNRATKQGAFCGIVVGVLVVAVTTIMHLRVGQLLPFLPDSFKNVNIGCAALALNVIVLAIASAVTQPHLKVKQSR